LGALTIKASRADHFHWIPRRRSYRFSSASKASVNTPARAHSCIRRWHVEPELNSLGNAFHWQPVRSRYRMPANTTRAGTGGRPPFGFGRSGGKSGSTTRQSASGTVRYFGSMLAQRIKHEASSHEYRRF